MRRFFALGLVMTTLGASPAAWSEPAKAGPTKPESKPGSPAPLPLPSPQAPKPQAPSPSAPTPKPQAPSPPTPTPKAAPKPAAQTKPTSPPKPAAPPKVGGKVSPQRKADPKGRRHVAGGPTFDEASLGAETPELSALQEAERELFPPAMPPLGSAWPSTTPSPMPREGDPPRPHASGNVPETPAEPPREPGRDLTWLEGLEMPDLPVRWDARLVRYLEFWKNDPRGHAMFAHWLKRSGRYRDAIRKTFAKKGVPEDLVWLAMVESGFEPTARSPVGALGMWQFMPETGKVYGLSQDRWADQRIHVQSATEAAADFLADLYRRFGSWELAMAAYNMGYGGITQVVKKYNTNDYFALSKLEGSLPWETTLYVPKILSCAIVSKNLAKFGFAQVVVDPPIAADEVRVPSGTPLSSVAQAAGVKPKEVEALNPELRAQRTPPGEPGSLYVVRVPAGKGPECAEKLAKAAGKGEPAERYVVKVGESISDIAESHRVQTSKLVELNAIAPGEVLHGGTVLLVPKGDDGQKTDTKRDVTKRPERPVVVVPADVFVYPDRTRVFYKVKAGDTVDKLAETFGVALDELRRWNAIDLRARLLEGMTLQVFVRDPKVLERARALAESDVDVVVSGSEAFFAHFEEKGRKRIVVTAKAGETLEAIGKRHGVTAKLMERINRRAKDEPLREGESVVLYVPATDPTPSRGDGEGKPLASALPPP
ncbi:MAG: transglycosylase SLT domain-containing protein [Polyangiaceae bacterium]